MQQSEFLIQYRGNFTSLLSWEQLDAFWETVRARAGAGWYIYTIGEDVPVTTRSESEVTTFLREIDALLRRDHDEDYCGIVYANSKTDPVFIKIFDPNNLGSSCGSSRNPPLPGWIMCLVAPQPLQGNHVLPEQRRRWWRSLWS